MLRKVTDQELISKLNGLPGNSFDKSKLSPVTDKSVLDKLNNPSSATGQLLAKAYAQGKPEVAPNRTPQMQEEFSNPTQQQGFNAQPQEQKLQQIQESAMNPANQNPLGGFVQPGYYESNPTRMAATTLPLMAQPELSFGEGLLSKYAINPLANATARIGAGTGSALAYNAPEIKDKNQLTDIARSSAKLNSLLEAGTIPFRMPAYFAEMFNPMKYAADKASQINREYQATKATTNEMYSPINEKYNGSAVTVTPKKYMESAGINRSDLYPDAKILYDKFLSEPTFENLHKMQSKLGNDWARIASHPATAEKAQLFDQMRESLKGKVQNFLSRDPEALDQYNLASEYAKNHQFPYTSTPTLRNITKGNTDIQPNKLSKSIDMATRKTVGNSERSVIPEGHPLRNHLKDLNKMIDFGNAAQYVAPGVLGAAGGELLHPGLGGVLGGSATALGASQMSKLASKFGAPNMTSFMQNPLVQGLFEKTSPWWYGLGRTGINASYPTGRK